MESFPESVRAYLATTHGPTREINLLQGLSGAQVWRVLFAHRSVIVKTSERLSEFAFYESVAPTLQASNIPVPTLEWSARIGQSTWLILEDIPHPFPRSRWHADPEQLSLLRRLHQLSGVPQLASPELFTPQWTSQMTEQALAWFSASAVNDLRHRLADIQSASQHLFTPQCYISGDPNPTNWGLRQDGTLVLFDWERFGRGTPPLDLAISIPGLGEAEIFDVVAAGYVAEETHINIKQLAHDIVFAKVWNVSEFLSMLRQDDDVPRETIEYLQQHFPAWLAGVDRMHN